MPKEESGNLEKMVNSFLMGKEILKPLNTGRIDKRVCCIREYDVNFYFYTRHGKTIMIDAGYNYDRLEEKMGWLDIKPRDIHEILLTHLDPDHVGALAQDSSHLFDHAKVYLGEIENRYLTGEKQRKVFKGAHTLPQVALANPVTLLKDEQVFWIDDIKIETLLVRGHTWGHVVYLIDDGYLFLGDTMWLGPDGGHSGINVLAEDNHLNKCALKVLKSRLESRNLKPMLLTCHSGWTGNFDFGFAHIDRACNGLRRQKPHDPDAPYDPWDESGDTEEKARNVPLQPRMIIG